MVLPVVLAGSHAHHAASQGSATGVWATLIHTLGYFTVTAAVALLVYQKFGLATLRRAWFNLDLIWAIALIVSGAGALLVCWGQNPVGERKGANSTIRHHSSTFPSQQAVTQT